MRRTALWTTPIALALALALGGCSGDNPFGIVTTEGGEFPITVSSGTSPTYDWTAGNARTLAVFRTDGLQVWRIEASGTNGFAPPVDHGITPAQATETVDGQFLESGTQHRIEVTLTDGRTGRETFTP